LFFYAARVDVIRGRRWYSLGGLTTGDIYDDDDDDEEGVRVSPRGYARESSSSSTIVIIIFCSIRLNVRNALWRDDKNSSLVRTRPTHN
jgi:hypothetical protein